MSHRRVKRRPLGAPPKVPYSADVERPIATAAVDADASIGDSLDDHVPVVPSMILKVLLPAWDTVVREARGTLALWVARADRERTQPPGRAARIASTFTVTPTSRTLGAAAVSRGAIEGRPVEGVWLRADPAYAMADLSSLRLMRHGDLGIAREDAESMIAALKPVFGDDGFELVIGDPDRWFLRAIDDRRGDPLATRDGAAASVPITTDPVDLLGEDLHAHLPDSRKWKRLLNEAQVLLHHHPVNAARVARGEVPANTVWFWGAGRRPDAIATPHARVLADDELLLAYADAAGAKRVADFREGEGNLVIECWSRASWDRFLAALPALDRALRAGDIGLVELECWTGERYTYRRGHRWRLWRRAR